MAYKSRILHPDEYDHDNPSYLTWRKERLKTIRYIRYKMTYPWFNLQDYLDNLGLDKYKLLDYFNTRYDNSRR